MTDLSQLLQVAAVRDSSMNAAQPLPILPGMSVFYFDDTPRELEAGKIYVVCRALDGEFTLTLRRAHVFKDRKELKPESTDDHPTITLSRSNEPPTDVVVGLVYGTFRSFEDTYQSTALNCGAETH
jgi:hypothetical protein